MPIASLTKKQKLLLFLVGVLPLIIAGMLFTPHFVFSFQRQGVIYAFSLIDSPWPVLALMSAIFVEVMLLGFYLFIEITTKGLKWATSIIGGCVVALSLVLSISFGHITENGISYNAPENLLLKCNVTWDKVKEPIGLCIIYRDLSRGGGPGYHCRVVFRTVGEPNIAFMVPFASVQERQSLINILKILDYNHKKVVTYIDRDTMELLSTTRDNELIDFYRKVQDTEITVTSRHEFRELDIR